MGVGALCIGAKQSGSIHVTIILAASGDNPNDTQADSSTQQLAINMSMTLHNMCSLRCVGCISVCKQHQQKEKCAAGNAYHRLSWPTDVHLYRAKPLPFANVQTYMQNSWWLAASISGV